MLFFLVHFQQDLTFRLMVGCRQLQASPHIHSRTTTWDGRKGHHRQTQLNNTTPTWQPRIQCWIIPSLNLPKINPDNNRKPLVLKNSMSGWCSQRNTYIYIAYFYRLVFRMLCRHLETIVWTEVSTLDGTAPRLTYATHGAWRIHTNNKGCFTNIYLRLLHLGFPYKCCIRTYTTHSPTLYVRITGYTMSSFRHFAVKAIIVRNTNIWNKVTVCCGDPVCDIVYCPTTWELCISCCALWGSCSQAKSMPLLPCLHYRPCLLLHNSK